VLFFEIIKIAKFLGLCLRQLETLSPDSTILPILTAKKLSKFAQIWQQ